MKYFRISKIWVEAKRINLKRIWKRNITKSALIEFWRIYFVNETQNGSFLIGWLVGWLVYWVLWHIVGVSPLQMDSPSCETYQVSSPLRRLGRAVTKNGCNVHDCVKLRRSFSQLSFLYLLFSFYIFLITHFRVVLSFQPPLDHNTY